VRVVVHDFPGHPFQVELSRELASRGHEVVHLYSAGTKSPRGQLVGLPEDPPTFAVSAVGEGMRIPRGRIIRRLAAERAYAGALSRVLSSIGPEVVLSSNASPILQHRMQRESTRRGWRSIWWVQDVYSVAARRILGRRSAVLGRVAGRLLEGLEARLAGSADHVVVISEDFLNVPSLSAIPEARRSVIHNWAPLESLPVRPRMNAWREQAGLGDDFVFLYAGTLGFKHDPSMLLALAREFTGRAVVVVASEGWAADQLARDATEAGVANLRILPFQPFETLPEMLGTGDVLLTLLEADAGSFAVPSKVLTSLCAGRPILMAAPPENLASRTVVEAGAGLVVRPGDPAAFVMAAEELFRDPALRERLGRSGRTYAEQHFEIRRIGDRFEEIVGQVTVGSPRP